MIDPMIDRLSETLASIGNVRPELAAKCAAMDEEIGRMSSEERTPS